MDYTEIEIEGMKEILKDKEKEINRLNAKIKKLEKELKDNQLYEEKLEHRIIEFEELLHWE